MKGDENMDESLIQLADKLWMAAELRRPIDPLRDAAGELGVATDVTNAYAIQRVNRDRRIRRGDRVVGRKIGLTSKAVQQQLGVSSPDYGDIWSRGAFGDGEEINLDTLLQPKVEAEVALVLGKDLNLIDATVADVIRATEFALPALEIVDSRIADWRIGLFDTIADNASAGAFVVGGDPVRLDRVSLRNAAMNLTKNSELASQGSGSACMGHPLNAAAWLAKALAAQGEPLIAGDIILTGALGPMVKAEKGDLFEASISGLGAVSVRFV